MISEERLEKALRYLAETDATSAEAEGEVLRAEHLVEMVEARIFLTSEGTVAERQARSKSSAEVAKASEEHVRALITQKTMRAKRATEALIVEVWRTEQANRRGGA